MMDKLGDTLIFDLITRNGTTGAVQDADPTPTCEVFEDANDTAILIPTVTKRTGKTGNYRISVAATIGNGFEVGKSYNVVVTATVGGVTDKSTIRFTLDGKRVADLHDATQGATKAELDAAVAPLAVEANVQGHVADALAAYDPPTRAEATVDKEELMTAVGGVPQEVWEYAHRTITSGGISLEDILHADLGDAEAFPVNSLADLIRKLAWMVCNKLVVLNADGTWTLYKGDEATLAATGSYTKSDETTERSGPAWS